jgi:predicted transcriptional regulator
VHRTQILLEPEQYDYLRVLAEQTGRSISFLVRTAVARFRAEEADRTRRALALLGAFEADRPDVSERHDELWSATVSG